MKYSFNKEEHLHTLDDIMLTGTSSVMSVLAKPLTWWAAGLAVSELGWVNPKKATAEQCLEASKMALERIKQLDPAAYAKLLHKAYYAHSKKLTDSADKGTDMHEELEGYVKYCMADGANPHGTNQVHPAVQAFAKWAMEKVDVFLWSELHTFSHTYFLGGITDCGARMKDGSIAIIDFKSSKEAYSSQFLQIGGYDIELTEQGGYTATGEKVFELPKHPCVHCSNVKELDCLHCHNKRYIQEKITQHIVFPFGAEKPEPAISFLVDENRQGFIYALGLYRTINRLENK